MSATKPECLPSRRLDPPLRTKIGRLVVSTTFAPSRAHPAWAQRWETKVFRDGDGYVEPEDGEEWTTDAHETWALRERRIAECAIAELRRLAEEITAVAEAAELGSIGITSVHVAAGKPDERRVASVLLHDAAGVSAVNITGHAEIGEWYHGQRDVRLADDTDGHRVAVCAIEVVEDLRPALKASVSGVRS